MHKLFIPKRIKEVKKELARFGGDFERESDFIYRSYHHSFKIMSIRFHALYCLNCCLYILGLTKELSRSDAEIIKMIKPFIRKPDKNSEWPNASLTYKIYKEMVDNNFMDQQLTAAKKKGKRCGWFYTSNHVVPYLGYYAFFRYLIDCMIKYAEDSKRDSQLTGFIMEYEGATEYFLTHLDNKTRKKFIKIREKFRGGIKDGKRKRS